MKQKHSFLGEKIMPAFIIITFFIVWLTGRIASFGFFSINFLQLSGHIFNMARADE